VEPLVSRVAGAAEFVPQLSVSVFVPLVSEEEVVAAVVVSLPLVRLRIQSV
jgi:hypothetical protein